MLQRIVVQHHAELWHLAQRCAAVILSSFYLSLGANAAPGDLDTSFGGSGYRLGGTIGSSSANLSAAMAIQADGKIIVAGRVNDTTAKFALLRYTASGVLDPKFGSNGLSLQQSESAAR